MSSAEFAHTVVKVNKILVCCCLSILFSVEGKLDKSFENVDIRELDTLDIFSAIFTRETSFVIS